MRVTKINFILLVLLLKTGVYAVGSLDTTLSGTDKSVVVQSFVTFDPGAYVKGFVDFQYGFGLPAGGTLMFSSVGTVNQSIRLNGGTLRLLDDIHLGSNVIIYGPGNIECPGPQSIILSSTTFIYDGVTLTTGGNIRGNGNLLYVYNMVFSPVNPSFPHGGAVTYVFDNVKFMSVSSSSFNTSVYYGDVFPVVADMRFYGSSIFMNADFYLNANITINGDSHIFGPGAKMTTNGILTINSWSSFTMEDGTTLCIQNLPPYSGGIIRGLDLTTEQFQLNNATLEFDINSNILSTKIVVNGNSIISSPIYHGPFYLGDGSALNDINLIINPGSKLIINDDTTVVYNCTD